MCSKWISPCFRCSLCYFVQWCRVPWRLVLATIVPFISASSKVLAYTCLRSPPYASTSVQNDGDANVRRAAKREGVLMAARVCTRIIYRIQHLVYASAVGQRRGQSTFLLRREGRAAAPATAGLMEVAGNKNIILCLPGCRVSLV